MRVGLEHANSCHDHDGFQASPHQMSGKLFNDFRLQVVSSARSFINFSPIQSRRRSTKHERNQTARKTSFAIGKILTTMYPPAKPGMAALRRHSAGRQDARRW